VQVPQVLPVRVQAWPVLQQVREPGPPGRVLQMDRQRGVLRGLVFVRVLPQAPEQV
jgi:hypothetical protein